MTDARFQAWLEKMKAAPQQEKDAELVFAVDNLAYAQVTALLEAGAGAQTQNGIPFLAWAIRRTDDWRMTELLLDAAVSAKGVAFRDLWAFFGEDKDRAYRLLQRLVDAGMELEERAQAAVYAVKDGQAGAVERILLKPGEDIVTLIDLGRAHDADGVLQGLKLDTAAEEALHDRHFAGGVTAEKLAASVDANGMTGFMLAVRAGRFGAAADHFRASGTAPGAEEIFREDRFGQSVVTLMGHRKILARLFAPDLWHSRPDSALVALDKVPARYAAQLDKPRLARDIARMRLAKTAKGRPFPPPASGGAP